MIWICKQKDRKQKRKKRLNPDGTKERPPASSSHLATFDQVDSGREIKGGEGGIMVIEMFIGCTKFTKK